MTTVGTLQPGTILQSRYKIVSILGTGGMSVVYLAEGLHLRQKLAVKEMHDKFVKPEMRTAAIKQFENEAATLAGLDHRGIPKVLDFFEEQDRHYLVMEHISGKTLEQTIQEVPQYPTEAVVLRWMEDVLETLEYLHSRPQPIVVRDIKPSNMILTDEGRVKLIDFGIAKIFDQSEKTATISRGSGSQGFAPPEQYSQEMGTDVRTDIYAAGVTMYFLLTKTLVPESVDRLLMGSGVKPPSYYNAMVSKKTDAIIMKMMELTPASRPQSVREVRTALYGKIESPQLAVPRTNDLPSTAPRLRNVDLPSNWDQTSRAADSSPASAPRKNPAMWIVPVAVVLVLGGAAAVFGPTLLKGGQPAAVASPSPAVLAVNSQPSKAALSPAPKKSPTPKPKPKKKDKITETLTSMPTRKELGKVVLLAAVPGDLRLTVKTKDNVLVITSQKVKPPIGLGIGATVEVKYIPTSKTTDTKKNTVMYAGTLMEVTVIPEIPQMPAGYPGGFPAGFPPGGLPPGFKIPAGYPMPSQMPSGRRRRPRPQSAPRQRLELLMRIVFLCLFLMATIRPVLADPADPLLAMGAQLMQAHQVDKAIAVFKKATDVSPMNPVAHNNLGYALEEKGMLDLALHEYVAALKLKPDYGDARDNVVHAACAKSRQLNDKGDYDNSIALLQKVTGDIPTAADAWYHLGLAYKESGQDKEALEAWGTAAKLRPDSGISRYVAGSEKMAAGDFDGAATEFRKATEKTPKNAYAFNSLGMALAQSRQMGPALASFQKAVQLQPTYANAWVNIGEVLSFQGQGPKALEAYQKAASANPKSFVAQMKLSQIYMSLSDLPHAEQTGKKAVQLKPDLAAVRLQMGLVYAKEQHYPEAVEEFKAGLKADPNDLSCHYALGLIYMAANDAASATRELQEVVRINPNHPYAKSAQEKLEALKSGATSASKVPTDLPTAVPPPPAAERPVTKGDVTLLLSPSWKDVPLSGEDANQFVGSFAQDGGATLWLYKPNKVPGGASLKAVAQFSANQAEKMGFTKKEETKRPFGGKDGYRYLFGGGPTDDFYLYVTLSGGYAYVMRAHFKNPADRDEFEKIADSAQLGH